MNIGIIGSGRIGGTVGRLWAYAGHQVLFSYSRDAANLKALAATVGPGARAGTPAEAARFGEVVLFAPPWMLVDDALREAGSLAGRILIDTTNPYGPNGVEDLGPNNSAAQEVARRAAKAHVVKAYNTLPADVLATSGREMRAAQLAMFFCGDGAEAKQVVSNLITASGYLPIDTGPLAFARYQEPNGPLCAKQLHEAEAYTLLDTIRRS